MIGAYDSKECGPDNPSSSIASLTALPLPATVRGMEFGLPQKSSGKLEQLSLLRFVESYLHYYAAASSHTARAKRLDLQHFLTFLTELRGCGRVERLKMRDWDHSAVQRFLEDRLHRGEAPASVARRLATLKHLGKTMAERIAGFVNPAREVKAPKVSPPRPQALTPNEIKAVLRCARERISDKASFIRKRNRMLLILLLETGLRAEEVRLLKRSHLDERLEWMQNVRTKGRRYRNVYIPQQVRGELRAYLLERDKELKRFYPKFSPSVDAQLPIFVSSYGAKAGKPETFFMGAKTIWRAVHELSARTKLHPHLLRHSFALDLLEDSHDVRLVSQALGHSDVRVTMRYTERKHEELANAIERKVTRRKLRG